MENKRNKPMKEYSENISPRFENVAVETIQRRPLDSASIRQDFASPEA